MRLSRCLGARAVDPADASVRRLADVVVRLDEPRPRATGLVLAGRRRGDVVLDWAGVRAFAEDRIVVDPARAHALAADELLLRRDLLDAQVVDVRGKRLARVGDIELELDGAELRAVAVDTGLAPVAERLGLRALAPRLRRDPLAWEQLHFASGRGHDVQLASPAAAVHRLGPEDLAALAATLPAEHEAELLAAKPAARRARRRRRRRFRVLSARKRAPS